MRPFDNVLPFDVPGVLLSGARSPLQAFTWMRWAIWHSLSRLAHIMQQAGSAAALWARHWLGIAVAQLWQPLVAAASGGCLQLQVMTAGAWQASTEAARHALLMLLAAAQYALLWLLGAAQQAGQLVAGVLYDHVLWSTVHHGLHWLGKPLSKLAGSCYQAAQQQLAPSVLAAWQWLVACCSLAAALAAQHWLLLACAAAALAVVCSSAARRVVCQVVLCEVWCRWAAWLLQWWQVLAGVLCRVQCRAQLLLFGLQGSSRRLMGCSRQHRTDSKAQQHMQTVLSMLLSPLCLMPALSAALHIIMAARRLTMRRACAWCAWTPPPPWASCMVRWCTAMCAGAAAAGSGPAGGPSSRRVANRTSRACARCAGRGSGRWRRCARAEYCGWLGVYL